MLEHIADFTAWPIITGILIGYVANRIMSGCQGKVDDVLKAYLSGNLKDSLESCDHHDCDHHEEKPVYVIPSFGK